VSAAGTQRNVAFARLLPRFGWKPNVLTVSAPRNRFERSGEPPPASIDVVRSYEWDLHRCLMLATGVLNRSCDLLGIQRRPSVFFKWCLPDPQIAWLTTVRGILLNRRYDCIYASCSPFSSALSACAIKKFTRKPLVLDFRDAWALNPHDNYSEKQRQVIRLFEQWAVRTCDALILNTPGAERLYRLKYPKHASKMTCIPNGYDRLNTPQQGARPERFTIMHVGDFYRSRNPNRLLEALANIGNREIEFVQVGPVFESYDRYKDRVSIRLIDRVAHAEAMRLMQSASLLYLSQGREEGVTDYIAIASKTYEYLATGLPILADCPPGDNADVVHKYAARSWVLTTTGASEVESAVLDAFTNRHATEPTVTSPFADEFNRERLAGRLAAVLDTAAGMHLLPDNARSTAYSKR
jgi:glycosyltransferase involved in cell wall biosynthesis